MEESCSTQITIMKSTISITSIISTSIINVLYHLEHLHDYQLHLSQYRDGSCVARAVCNLFVCRSADPGYPRAMLSQGALGIDFSDGSQGMPATKKPKREGQTGEPQPWLRVFETCPAQLLNAYGMSKIATMPDDKVWEALTKPLSTGAMYGTELASQVYFIISSS